MNVNLEQKIDVFKISIFRILRFHMFGNIKNVTKIDSEYVTSYIKDSGNIWKMPKVKCNKKNNIS